MRRYLLIGGSILTIVLLSLFSLVNVIGFQTCAFSTPPESPLFAVQTTQAIEGNRPLFKTDYTGKGTASSFLFPDKTTRDDPLGKALAVLAKMTPQQIKKLHHQLVLFLSQKTISPQAASSLVSFDNERQSLQDAFGIPTRNGTSLQNDPPTFYCPTLFGYWVPSCFVEGLILVLLFLLSASVYAFCTFFLCYWIYHSVFLCKIVP
jgi:hypothetical protein